MKMKLEHHLKSKANKKIKSFATVHWDAQKAARPLFKRYT